MAKEEKKNERQSAPETPEIAPLPGVDPDRERELLEQRGEAARQQAERRIDEETEEGVAALRRAEEDAQPGFQTLRDQIEIDELRALDRQALYAELRGDRGGLGRAQLDSIRNTAAVNRRQLGLEQQRLASETARQIEDLRRRGEFRKADAVLELTQKQLSELMELERWAQEKNMNAAQFNTELARWEAEYAWKLKRFGLETELDLARLSGLMPDGSPTYAARQDERSRLASAAKTLLELGLSLTPEQREALGWSEGQYEDYIRRSSAASAAAPAPASSGGGTQSGSGGKAQSGSGGKAQSGGAGKSPRGEGAPFQLVASWAAALQSSDKPQELWAQMRASSWYGQMNAEQQRWINSILHERGLD